MKMIEAIVRPHMLDEVKQALVELGTQGMTVSEVRGFGRQKGNREIYRGAEYTTEFVPKVKIELVVPEKLAPRVIDTIMRSARTGSIGDGKIVVGEISALERIRTGEMGESAVA